MQKQNTILIVDDNMTNIAIIKEILEDYKIISANSGDEALIHAQKHKPDITLLDIMMPGKNGYEVCKIMRADPVLRLGKIIMVSAKALTDERLEGYKAGADDYLTKPFEASELLAKVQVYLRLKSEEEVNQLKSDFLRLLHLETNNPLNSIIGPVDILKDNINMEAGDRANWLGIIKRGAMQLQELFEKVVTLSSIRSGSLPSEKEKFDLSTLIRESLVKVSKEAMDKNIVINQKLLDSAPTLVDRLQITRVVITLIRNAIRFSHCEGIVTISLTDEDNSYCIQVSDSGKGIHADALPHIFDEFSHFNLKHRSEGHGLNLAISHHIVLEHKGTIKVVSTEGSGSTFTVKIPKGLGENVSSN